MKMELKILITQLENSKEKLTSDTSQRKTELSGLEDKVEDLDKTNKNMGILGKHRKRTCKKYGTR